MTTSTIRKFGVGVASLALVVSAAAPAMAAEDKDVLPGLIASKADRLAGADRIATSLKVADHAFKNMHPTTVYIANAEDAHLIDATTAGMITDGPIVFVNNNAYVATAVGKSLADKATYPSFDSFAKVVAIGGTASISDATLDTVVKEVGATAKDRISGETRYDTAVAIADYIYNKALKKEDGYQRLLSGTNLSRVYIANGEDNHLVDAMVAGTLDDGPILLADGSGKLSEKTQEFIKKTLPGEFAALGGTAAVTDQTVNDAWLIKALANDWTESYDIPALKKTATEAEFLLNGYDNSSTGVPLSRNPKDFNFMGLTRAKKTANDVRQLWSTTYDVVKLDASQALRDYLKNNGNLTADQFLTTLKNESTAGGSYASTNNDAQNLQAFVGDLIKLYGDTVATAASDTATVQALDASKADGLKPFLALSDGKVTGFNFAGFESSKKFSEKVSDANEAIARWWRLGNVDADSIQNKDGNGVNYVAVASQKETIAAATSTMHAGANGDITKATPTAAQTAIQAPLAAVKATAAWVADQVEANRKAAEDALNEAQSKLRVALDKVAPKTVLRLGGKTRFETAAWIANEWAKDETGIRVDDDLDEVYVANGVRPADAIVAGQLKNGPILLVPGEGEIPAPIISTAKSLPLWNKDNDTVYVLGIGGTAVLPDAQLQKIVDAANSVAPTSTSGVSVQNSVLSVSLASTTAKTDVYANGAFADAVEADGLAKAIARPSGADSNGADDPTLTFNQGTHKLTATNKATGNIVPGSYVYKITVPGKGSTYVTVKVSNVTPTLAPPSSGKGLQGTPVAVVSNGSTQTTDTSAAYVADFGGNPITSSGSFTLDPATQNIQEKLAVTVTPQGAITLTPTNGTALQNTAVSGNVSLKWTPTSTKSGYNSVTQSVPVYYTVKTS